MARTEKDKPFRVTNRYRTRWNDCSTHGKACSHNSELNRKNSIRRRNERQSQQIEE